MGDDCDTGFWCSDNIWILSIGFTHYNDGKGAEYAALALYGAAR